MSKIWNVRKHQGKVKRVQMTEEDVERLKGYEQNTRCLTETKFWWIDPA